MMPQIHLETSNGRSLCGGLPTKQQVLGKGTIKAKTDEKFLTNLARVTFHECKTNQKALSLDLRKAAKPPKGVLCLVASRF